MPLQLARLGWFVVLLALARPASAQCCGSAPAKTEAAPESSNRRVLRISADPNNLPFTNEAREGFENRIAELLAKELDADIRYSWHAQRRGFFRSSLTEGESDLVLGVPSGFERALTTAPYYRSSYVFVSRKDRNLAIRSFDDPALKSLKIGVQLIGDDGTNTPPAHALALRGLIENVRGFTVYGDYTERNPPARIVEAVLKGDVDIAVVWGPLAGYFGKANRDALTLSPVEPGRDRSGLPMGFDIALGVRKGDKELRDRLDAILARKRAEIDAILDEFGVPRQPIEAPGLARKGEGAK